MLELIQAMNISDYKIYVINISASGLSIYDPIDPEDKNLWIPTPNLEMLLDDFLKGLSLKGYPLRTRSKILKQKICKAMGYPVPSNFQKTQPRFPGQKLDTYAQKSNNLQIWNEEIEPIRRYAIIKLDDSDKVIKVKVLSGQELALLDKTGTLTKKYQARVVSNSKPIELASKSDTQTIKSLSISTNTYINSSQNPTDSPKIENLLSIDVLFSRLSLLVGGSFKDEGSDQERNRGAALHRLVCKALGYSTYRDAGRFPDVLNQLLEVKLQTSPTIDLGLVSPNSEEPIGIPDIADKIIRHCDVRYAIFCGNIKDDEVTITNLILVTGEDFFKRFPQFQGKVVNAKIQIPLPKSLFDL